MPAQPILRPFLADRPVDKPLFSPTEALKERRGIEDFNSKRPPGEHYTRDRGVERLSDRRGLLDGPVGGVPAMREPG